MILNAKSTPAIEAGQLARSPVLLILIGRLGSTLPAAFLLRLGVDRGGER